MNAAKTPDELLDKLPKKTPKWAVGIVTILVAISTSFLAIYIFAKEDIHQTIQWAQETQTARLSTEAKDYSDTLGRVLVLLDINSNQIVELSKALSIAQQQNQFLAQRVDNLEQKVDKLNKDLNICEAERDRCLKGVQNNRR
jgi:uncharacterized protein YoxC